MNKPWFWPRARLLRLPRLWLHRMPMPDICEDSTGTTDTLGCAFREGPMRTPCSLRTPRLRAPTIIRACQTFSLDRGVDALKLSIDDAGRSALPGFSFIETTSSSAASDHACHSHQKSLNRFGAKAV